MTGLRVRPLAPADKPRWRELWILYLEFYRTRLPEEMIELAFARFLSDDPEEGHALLAERDGVLIGLVHYYFQRHGWRREKVIYLQDLFTAPEARGTGAGTALIEAVYAAADDAGTPVVYWLTQDFNETARRLYDQVAEVTPFIKYQRNPG